MEDFTNAFWLLIILVVLSQSCGEDVKMTCAHPTETTPGTCLISVSPGQYSFSIDSNCRITQ